MTARRDRVVNRSLGSVLGACLILQSVCAVGLLFALLPPDRPGGPTVDDRPDTAQQIAIRHAQLDRYRLAYAEVYGRQPSDELEANDPILRELRGDPPPARGHRVVIEAPAQLAGVSGVLLSTAKGFAMVKADRSGAIYQVRTSAVRVTS